LDKDGYNDTLLLSYAAKFASAFYGPFRDAADSTPAFGDRKTYQMPSTNAREAMREIQLDLEEGADAVMVKPALTALDLIARAKHRFLAPVWAYHVSGEYSMIKAAGKLGWLNEEAAMRRVFWPSSAQARTGSSPTGPRKRQSILHRPNDPYLASTVPDPPDRKRISST